MYTKKLSLLSVLALLAGCSPGEVKTDAATAASQSPATLQAVAPQAQPISSPPASAVAVAPSGSPSVKARVLLGSPEFTAGIPGEGPLSADEIKAWLAAEVNHEPLEIELPLGLAAGAAGIRVPEDNPLTRAKIELGRQLYFDPRLSADASVSCADCHHPDDGYARATQFGVGIGGQTGGRNSPASYNRILSGPQFWDGRAASLEEQAIGPIANPIEMGNTHDACVSTIAGIEGYQLQFARVFGNEVTIDNVGKAIASFERVLVTGPTPYDYYEPLRILEERFADDLEDLETLKEEDPELYEAYLAARGNAEDHPMSESARRGRTLFFSERGGCTACHAGANFTDEQYHNLGVGMEKPEPDLGRFVVTGAEKDRGAFKTPTIRNVVFTAPYMHDGSLKTLEEVVEWYDRGGHPNPYLSDKVKKLNLTAQEKEDLVEFMKACTGEFPKVATGRLPQ